MTIVMVKTEDLVFQVEPSENNPKVKNLILRIKSEGLITPLKVTKKIYLNRIIYKIIDGDHRCKACILLNFKEIKCDIFDECTILRKYL